MLVCASMCSRACMRDFDGLKSHFSYLMINDADIAGDPDGGDKFGCCFIYQSLVSVRL